MALMLFHTRSLYSGHVCKLCATGRCLQQCSCNASKSPQLLKSAWNFYTSHQQTFSTRPSLFRQLIGDKRGALWNLWRVPDIHRSQNGYMLQWQQYKSDYLKWSGTQTRWNSHFLPGLNHDLRRFLEEVSTSCGSNAVLSVWLYLCTSLSVVIHNSWMQVLGLVVQNSCCGASTDFVHILLQHSNTKTCQKHFQVRK